jgi:hypothetical protein
MKKYSWYFLILNFFVLFFSTYLFAQNPIILDQFSADPSARVFEGKAYLYPSHDILANEERGRIGWFCMEDYHVFSSENLTEWTDHGVIVSQENVPWVNSKFYSMWAPDCIYKNGKYYFYFPAPAKDTTLGRGFSIGVAVSNSPYGPFIPQSEPIKGVHGIDPNPFIDEDGQAYLYWSAKKIYVAKLKENMLELANEPMVIANLPEKGLKEGPYLFERNRIYYLTYPHVENATERLEYAIADNPLGPFKLTGVIMDESPTCWTNHQSIIEYKNQWYLFYHNNDLSPEFDKARSVRIDSLFFNEDGTIKKLIPSIRGVGITDAKTKIQIDRYNEISKEGALLSFIDSTNKQEGWKISLVDKDAFVQYNGVNFGNNNLNSVNIRTVSLTGGLVDIRLDKVDGPLLVQIRIDKSSDWRVINTTLAKIPSCIHNLFVVLKDKKDVDIDWISFE